MADEHFKLRSERVLFVVDSNDIEARLRSQRLPGLDYQALAELVSYCCVNGGFQVGDPRYRIGTSVARPTEAHFIRSLQPVAAQVVQVIQGEWRFSLTSQGYWPHVHPAGGDQAAFRRVGLRTILTQRLPLHDTLIIVSGDSSLIPLLRYWRERRRKRVITVTTSDTVPAWSRHATWPVVDLEAMARRFGQLWSSLAPLPPPIPLQKQFRATA